MTQLASDPQVPQPAPATPAPAATPPATNTEEFIQVPKHLFDDTPGGYHEVIRRSKAYDALMADGWGEVPKELGMTGYQLMDVMAAQDPVAPAAAAEPAAPAAPLAPPPEAPQPVTLEQIGQLMEQRFTAFRDENTQASHRSQDLAARKTAMDAETTFANETLKALGLEPEVDGKPSSRHADAQAMFNRRLNEMIKLDVPEHFDEQRRKEALSAPATPEQLQRAAESMTAAYKDWHNEAVASHAQTLGEQPPTSLAGGPGGGDPPKNYEDLSHQEKVMAITAGMAGRDE